MKKILCLTLVTLLCVLLVGCTQKSNDTYTESTIDPIEQAKEKLEEAYEECCADSTAYPSFASLGYDKMSLIIDTNPDNSSYYSYESAALSAIFLINRQLELPSSISDKMSSTRALDGMQTQNCGEYTVTWNYHPDNGLKVIYEVNE